MTRYLMGPNGIGYGVLGGVYGMEYDRGDSAMGVHRKKKFKTYVRSCKNFVILRNEREHSRVPVIGLPVRRTVRRT